MMPRTQPDVIVNRNREQRERTIMLTQLAIKKLEDDGKNVTLKAVALSTCDFTSNGKGISEKTISRNPEAADLFRQHSQNITKKQHAKAQRKQPSLDTQSRYHGLSTIDLIQMIEELKTDNLAQKEQIKKLIAQRDQAYALRDEALEQNAHQLAQLTHLLQQK